MRFHHLDPDRCVLELPGPRGLEVELQLWWGDGERTRALWLLSQSGRALGWAVVGEA